MLDTESRLRFVIDHTPLPVGVLQLAPDHQLYQIVFGDLADRRGPDVPPIA